MSTPTAHGSGGRGPTGAPSARTTTTPAAGTAGRFDSLRSQRRCGACGLPKSGLRLAIYNATSYAGMSAEPGISRSVVHGDEARFRVAIDFGMDPDAEDRRAPDLKASWGELRIWVQGQNLCDH